MLPCPFNYFISKFHDFSYLICGVLGIEPNKISNLTETPKFIRSVAVRFTFLYTFRHVHFQTFFILMGIHFRLSVTVLLRLRFFRSIPNSHTACFPALYRTIRTFVDLNSF